MTIATTGIAVIRVGVASRHHAGNTGSLQNHHLNQRFLGAGELLCNRLQKEIGRSEEFVVFEAHKTDGVVVVVAIAIAIAIVDVVVVAVVGNSSCLDTVAISAAAVVCVVFFFRHQPRVRIKPDETPRSISLTRIPAPAVAAAPGPVPDAPAAALSLAGGAVDGSIRKATASEPGTVERHP